MRDSPPTPRRASLLAELRALSARHLRLAYRHPLLINVNLGATLAVSLLVRAAPSPPSPHPPPTTPLQAPTHAATRSIHTATRCTHAATRCTQVGAAFFHVDTQRHSISGFDPADLLMIFTTVPPPAADAATAAYADAAADAAAVYAAAGAAAADDDGEGGGGGIHFNSGVLQRVGLLFFVGIYCLTLTLTLTLTLDPTP